MNEKLCVSNVLQPRLAQFDENGGGNSGGGLSRRRFIKRAGGATAATFLAWQGLSMQARAALINKSSSSSGSKSNWKIKVEAFEYKEYTNGQSVPFTYQDGGVTATAWYKISRLRIASAPGTNYAPSATCSLTVKAKHWGQVKWEQNGIFAPMTPQEWSDFKQWFPNVFSDAEHELKGSLTKHINSGTGRVTTYSPVVDGKTPDEPGYDETDTDNGIGVSIHWQEVVNEGDAKVDVGDSGGYLNTLPDESATHDVVFIKKAFSIKK